MARSYGSSPFLIGLLSSMKNLVHLLNSTEYIYINWGRIYGSEFSIHSINYGYTVSLDLLLFFNVPHE